MTEWWWKLIGRHFSLGPYVGVSFVGDFLGKIKLPSSLKEENGEKEGKLSVI